MLIIFAGSFFCIKLKKRLPSLECETEVKTSKAFLMRGYAHVDKNKLNADTFFKQLFKNEFYPHTNNQRNQYSTALLENTFSSKYTDTVTHITQILETQTLLGSLLRLGGWVTGGKKAPMSLSNLLEVSFTSFQIQFFFFLTLK